MSIYSISSIIADDGTYTVNVGKTTISGVPTLEKADQFISICACRWPNGEEILNEDSLTVGLIGGFLIDEVIQGIS